MNEAKHRFFCEDIHSGFLSEEESMHALRVLRLKIGDVIQLIDGKGLLCVATITDENKKGLCFLVTKKEQKTQAGFDIHIAIAPTKNIDRFAFFLEKVTEIGVSRITPILSKNSERRDLKVDKLRKNLIAAMKQSGNLFLPVIDEAIDLKKFLESQTQSTSKKFIAHCYEDSDKLELKNQLPTNKKVVILIGPEGDFTMEEVTLAKQTDFCPVSLGESRLRTETAGIIACHTVHII